MVKPTQDTSSIACSHFFLPRRDSLCVCVFQVCRLVAFRKESLCDRILYGYRYEDTGSPYSMSMSMSTCMNVGSSYEYARVASPALGTAHVPD